MNKIYQWFIQFRCRFTGLGHHFVKCTEGYKGVVKDYNVCIWCYKHEKR